MVNIIGGANGIGAEIVGYLYKYGAHIVFGDIEASTWESTANKIKTKFQSPSSLEFVAFDIRKYDGILALFQLAYKKHARIDHAPNVAGITEKAQENWFDPALDMKGVTTAPPTAIVDVNST